LPAEELHLPTEELQVLARVAVVLRAPVQVEGFETGPAPQARPVPASVQEALAEVAVRD